MSSRVKGVHICDDPAYPKIQERAEKYIKASKPSNIVTTSHYRIFAMV
jgi:hypothetical protein